MSNEYTHNIDATVSAVASKVTYGGAAASSVSWFFSSEFGVLCGILIGLIGLGVNWYFKRREDRRHQAEHEARMRKLRLDTSPAPMGEMPEV
jgi:hypothetical protein